MTSDEFWAYVQNLLMIIHEKGEFVTNCGAFDESEFPKNSAFSPRFAPQAAVRGWFLTQRRGGAEKQSVFESWYGGGGLAG